MPRENAGDIRARHRPPKVGIREPRRQAVLVRLEGGIRAVGGDGDARELRCLEDGLEPLRRGVAAEHERAGRSLRRLRAGELLNVDAVTDAVDLARGEWERALVDGQDVRAD